MSARPLPLRVLPGRLRQSLFYRYYLPRRLDRPDLFRRAALRLAPQFRMELLPSDVHHAAVAFTGEYEPRLGARVVELGRAGGTMLDIGANAGYFTLLWLSAAAANRVAAWEASPRNVRLLGQNLTFNGVAGRVELHAAAASNASGTATFDPGPEDQTGWGSLVSGSAEGDASGAEGVGAELTQFKVPTERIDAELPADLQIPLMKIDVEGAEGLALEGCEGLLRSQRVKEIWFEQNKPGAAALGVPVNRPLEILRDHGYDCRPVGKEDGELIDWIASPRPNR